MTTTHKLGDTTVLPSVIRKIPLEQVREEKMSIRRRIRQHHLRNVLIALDLSFPEVGYCQGMVGTLVVTPFARLRCIVVSFSHIFPTS